MRLTRQTRTPTTGQLNMASMIDVVFLLLIFFMCTSSFSGAESNLPTQMPQVGGGLEGLQRDFEPVRIRVNHVGHGVLVTLDSRACGTYDELTRRLRARRAIDDLPVIIEGDPLVPFRYMVAALDACHAADLHRVAFSAKGAAP